MLIVIIYFKITMEYALSVIMLDLYSRIRLQVAIKLLNDLRELANGDTSRFARMVDGRGHSILSEQDAIQGIKSIINDSRVLSFYPMTCKAIHSMESIAS